MNEDQLSVKNSNEGGDLTHLEDVEHHSGPLPSNTHLIEEEERIGE